MLSLLDPTNPLAALQYPNLWLTAVAYNITGAGSMQVRGRGFPRPAAVRAALLLLLSVIFNGAISCARAALQDIGRESSLNHWTLELSWIWTQ